MNNNLNLLSHLPARGTKRSCQSPVTYQQHFNIGSNHEVYNAQLNNAGISSLDTADELTRSIVEKIRSRTIFEGSVNRSEFVTATENQLPGGLVSKECWKPHETFMLQPQNMTHHGSNNYGLEAFSSHASHVSSIPRPTTAFGAPLDSFGSRKLIHSLLEQECWNPSKTSRLQPQNMTQHGSNNYGLKAFSFHTSPVSSIPRPKTALGSPLDSFGSSPSCFFSVPTIGPETTKRDFSRTIHHRHHPSIGVNEDIQRVHKSRKIEHPDLSDDWSLLAILHEAKQSSVTKHQQLATANSKQSSSIQNSEKDLQMDNGVASNQNMGNVNASFFLQNSLTYKRQIECCYTDKVKSDLTLRLKHESYDGIPNLIEEPPIIQEEKIKIMPSAKHGRADANCYPPESTVCGLSGVELRKNEVGISLLDFFSAEEIKEHMCSLNQRNNQNVGESVKNGSRDSLGGDTCQLCEMDEIKLAPPSVYCASCEARIKRNLSYYWTVDEMGTRHCFCTRCYRNCHGKIPVERLSISKEKLRKAKNTEEDDEAWVQCDNCEHWQHQICALYNSKHDLEGKIKYTCPVCRLAEMKAGEHVSKPLAIGAQDLPRTLLSDHLEQRLSRSLERERKQRAESLGTSPEEVPGASDLTVRVVLSVDKQVKVSPKFLDILHGENYPTEFPYRLKVILLFQKIEGVDVSLFAIYVQEFGSECEQPNQRSVYISYLDSVKHFRPEIKTVAGEALRTFVYHEIMIGYLSYCKQRGFTTCYIWACPPSKGDDYIFYCHPEDQKIPKNLRAWYKKFLQKAKEENVVVETTNFYDCFCIPSGKDDHKITAARLPYFDGDYWSGAVVDIIQNIEKDSDDKSERKAKKTITKRSLRKAESVDVTLDVQVMQQLGRTILPNKEDFFVVRLQFTCMNCSEAIVTGNRWTCNQCCYHLCSRCHDVMNNPGRGTCNKFCLEKHLLHQIAVDVPANTNDKDVILDNEFFESRFSFLSFCEKNHYQFDTLRRSKHSSMMILYHIQKMTELTVGTICSICQQHTTVEWHCEICSEFLVCSACYQKEGNGCHVHKLIQHLTKSDLRTTVEEKQQQLRALETKTLLDLLLHSNRCISVRGKSCSYPNCQDIKDVFLHNQGCALRMAGGCEKCGLTWYYISLHSRNCRDSSCKFPRCLEVRNYKARIAAESEVQRRDAVQRRPLQQHSMTWSNPQGK